MEMTAEEIQCYFILKKDILMQEDTTMWARFPNDLMSNKDLTVSAKFVYVHMLWRYMHFSKVLKMPYRESQDQIADACSLGRTCVVACIKVLCEAGFIEKKTFKCSPVISFNTYVVKDVYNVYPVDEAPDDVRNQHVPVAVRQEGWVTDFELTDDFLKSDDFLRTQEWREMRQRVFIRDGNYCRCCGAKPGLEVFLCVDHIKPRKTHPDLALDEDNLQVLCNECNGGKLNWHDTDWRQK